MPVFSLSASQIVFPSPHLAHPDGLLAIGGDLSVPRLLQAYRMGIFPWYSANEPILWWSPDPRLVLLPQELHISRSLKKTIKQNIFVITVDNAFEDVIEQCAAIRQHRDEGTWIVSEMIEAYTKLHQLGFAHSVEAWCNGELVGGLYGVSLGKCFFGESMFTKITNASKVAFVTLAEYLKTRSFELIDCQVTTDHLMRFGAKEIPRRRFLKLLDYSLQFPTLQGKWQMS